MAITITSKSVIDYTQLQLQLSITPCLAGTNFHQITYIFYMLLEDSFGVKSISKFAWSLEAYIQNVYAFC